LHKFAKLGFKRQHSISPIRIDRQAQWLMGKPGYADSGRDAYFFFFPLLRSPGCLRDVCGTLERELTMTDAQLGTICRGSLRTSQANSGQAECHES
jgi:hypothetical protein